MVDGVISGFRDVALLYNVSHVQAWPRWTLPALSVIHLRTKSLLISAWKLFYRHPTFKTTKIQQQKALKLRLDFRLPTVWEEHHIQPPRTNMTLLSGVRRLKSCMSSMKANVL